MECPGCFWSTSVKKQEDAPVPAAKTADPGPRPQSAPNFTAIFDSVRPVILPFFILIAAAAVVVPNWPRIETFLRQREESILAGKAAVIKPDGLDGQAVHLDDLSDEEKAVLTSRIQLAADRQPDAEENKILQNAAPFQTGFSEKIPSQAWTYEKFKQVLGEEERRYKVPLPGSYKGKLEGLFKKNYLPGADAFKAGDLARARDFWVKSLAFPVYSNNLAKHRGVALTMLRPFINDTLSKIGTINSTLTEQKVRDKERALFDQHAELRPLIEKKSWPEAAAVILKIEDSIGELENAGRLTGNPHPYPEEINRVDEEIRATLFDILVPQAPAVSDLVPLEQDIQAKKKVIESFLAENLKAQQEKYDEALEMIRGQNWLEAEKKFREIELPAALAADAREKVKVLQKLQKPALDSGPKSS